MATDVIVTLTVYRSSVDFVERCTNCVELSKIKVVRQGVS